MNPQTEETSPTPTVFNPLTKRQVKVGSKVYKRLIKDGVIECETNDCAVALCNLSLSKSIANMLTNVITPTIKETPTMKAPVVKKPKAPARPKAKKAPVVVVKVQSDSEDADDEDDDVFIE